MVLLLSFSSPSIDLSEALYLRLIVSQDKRAAGPFRVSSNRRMRGPTRAQLGVFFAWRTRARNRHQALRPAYSLLKWG